MTSAARSHPLTFIERDTTGNSEIRPPDQTYMSGGARARHTERPPRHRQPHYFSAPAEDNLPITSAVPKRLFPCGEENLNPASTFSKRGACGRLDLGSHGLSENLFAGILSGRSGPASNPSERTADVRARAKAGGAPR
jgi:hypothetical protein